MRQASFRRVATLATSALLGTIGLVSARSLAGRGRPVFVSEDANGTLWRIAFTGE